MIKQKHVSTSLGIVIIVIAIVIFFGGVFAWQYFFVKSLFVESPQIQDQTVGEGKYNQREQLLIKELLGYWGEVDKLSDKDINCGLDYEFSIDDNGLLIYNSWLYCSPMDSGTWSIKESVLSFKGPADFEYSNNFKLNGNYLDFGTDGYLKRITGDPLINEATKESIEKWEKFINK